MPADKLIDYDDMPGYRWLENGQSALTGDLLELYQRLDQLFVRWAAECGAREYLFPTFIPARELAKVDYFRSFPHLITCPVTLDADTENLKRFADGQPIDANGNIQLTQTAPIRDVLTPAACYHFYIHFQGDTLDKPRYLTTRATCFRREAYYAPLERQWGFSMREIVCIGSVDEVKEFLARYRERLDCFAKDIGLPVKWENATDPFFDPSSNPKYLCQKLDPVKTEMVFQNRLPIGSVNFHRNYFGEAFQIKRCGKEAFSGCVAFGIERWVMAFLTRFGSKPSDWPNLLSRKD